MTAKKSTTLNDTFTDGLPLIQNVTEAIGLAQAEGKTPTLELTEEEHEGVLNDTSFMDLAESDEAKDGKVTIKSYRGFPVKVLTDKELAAKDAE